jgi:hypothetical protein
MVFTAAKLAQFVPSHVSLEHVPFGLVQAENMRISLKQRSCECCRRKSNQINVVHHYPPKIWHDGSSQYVNVVYSDSQYTAMNNELIEYELYKQRQQGYVGSIQSDRQRQIRQQQEEKERIRLL